MKHKLMQELEKLESFGQYALGIPVLCSILIVTIGVVTRLMSIPASWTDEVLQVLFVWLVFIVSALAFKDDGLIGLNLFEDMLKKGSRAYKILKLIQAILATIFVFFMLTQTYSIVIMQYNSQELSPVMGFPMWTKNLGYFLGCVLFCVFGVWKLFKSICAFKTKAEE